MNFNHLLPLLALCLLTSGCEQKTKAQQPLLVEENATLAHIDKSAFHKELKEIDTNMYLESYITSIINDGSKATLGFSAGDMDGGFATKEDAPNIARYVLILANKKSSDDTLGKKSQLFYTSNCGGCHGDDGKGLNGAFPDLTLSTLKGIAKRKAYLEVMQ